VGFSREELSFVFAPRFYWTHVPILI